jgi:hypothetical protein
LSDSSHSEYQARVVTVFAYRPATSRNRNEEANRVRNDRPNVHAMKTTQQSYEYEARAVFGILLPV